MDSPIIEVKYPLKFRQDDARILGEHLRLRHNVDVVGMKRVGVGDFLNFFLYHSDIVKKYIDRAQKHLLIAVDLNDLVEIKLFAFWILTFKRLVDILEKLPIETKLKKQINLLFLGSIETHSLFLVIENIRKVILETVKSGYLPTIFFLRFDRITSLLNSDFFANLSGLREASFQKLAYVFTSFRSLTEASPALFSHVTYIKPAGQKDAKTILKVLSKKYRIRISGKMEKKLIESSGGHAQYLYLSLISLGQDGRWSKMAFDDLVLELVSDERINLQSEEIWESLSPSEKSVLAKVVSGGRVATGDRKANKYLWETGLVKSDEAKNRIFSPLLQTYLEKNRDEVGKIVDLTKKENLLFSVLTQNLGRVCEREEIIERVWPEYEDLGVSDWTIDKLVARLRIKLSFKRSGYSIVTVKTRGFKLVKE